MINYNYDNVLLGRKKILLTLPCETTFTNEEGLHFGAIPKEELLEVLRQALPIHLQNAEEIQYLYEYYKGNQNILFRTDKVVRPEIDNRIVENRAKYIIDFKTGFVWGEPIQLINDYATSDDLYASKETKPEKMKEYKDEQINAISKYLKMANKMEVDKECGFWECLCGLGYVAVLPNTETTNIYKNKVNTSPFKLISLDPRTTFCVYDARVLDNVPAMAVTYTTFEAEDKYGKKNIMFDFIIYTKNNIYTLRVAQDEEDELYLVDGVFGEVRYNALRQLPIIEFSLNQTRQGAFEPVLPLLNSLNLICSDRLNDVEQAVQWFLKFINVDIDEEQYERFIARGVIIAKGEPGNSPQIDSVYNTLNQSQIQIFKDDIVKSIHIISNVPERNANPGDNTGQALIIGQGWADAEADAKNIETLQRKFQKQLMDVVLNYCYTLNVDLKSKYSEECWLDANDIEIKFTRNRSDSQLVKTQSLKNMLDSGVAPLVAFKYSGIFSDPQKAYEQSKEYLDKFYEAKSPRENGEKQLDINSAGNEYNLSQNMQKEFKKAEN